MFGKILASVSCLVAGGLKCPRCGHKNTAIPQDEAQPLSCAQCGYRASLTEWAMRSQVKGEAKEEPDPDHPPADTRITRQELAPGCVTWEIPPSGRSGGLLFFCTLWLGFCTLWTGGATFAVIKGGDSSGEAAPWLFPLFSVPFWAVGIGMLYAGLRGKYARHRVSIDSAEVVLTRSLFGREKRKAMARMSVTEVSKREFYQQNYKPVYGVEIRGSAGKLRFGTTLTEEEKDWLVADIRRVLKPVAKREAQVAASGPLRLAMPASGDAAVVENPGSVSFSCELPPAKAAGQVVGVVIGLVVVAVFIGLGLFVMDDAKFFRVIWLGMSSLFAVAMIASLVNIIRSRGVVWRVDGTGDLLVVQRRKGYRVLKEEQLPRDGTEVRMYETGSSNQTRMVSVELVAPERVVKLVRWYPADQAEPFVQALRAGLGRV